MPKTLLILIACFITSFVSAQHNENKPTTRPDSVGYYMLNETTMAYNDQDAKFVRLLIKTDSSMFRANDYYMDGTTRLIAKTTVDQINFERGARGICYEYYPNGKRKSIKYFDKGVLVGDAVTYYTNGGLHTIENYSSKGIYLKQYLDTAGNVLANNGTGTWLKVDEEKIYGYMEGPVLNGKEDGHWKRYVADTVYTIVYKQGEIISGKEFLNKINVFDVAPSFPGGDFEFGKYLARNIRYPAIARENNVQGRVVLTFVVEKDGAITEIKVLRSLGSGCDEESIRVLSLSPNWKPGLTKGKPVRVKYAMPISFILQNENAPANNRRSRRSF
ncbi:energy transducer TonB [Mucilaginibacter aquariorum]|uniref:TonB family protein n=1 Tax=Mucilaginibacter aquariorum TaxID=2967225 RepID=A0ABT1SX08_9SPHI|nr:energy transducer TonB [Mucilaginibacter aquariorum]MCQ6956735.1 TonB family protein [Mucilaginibacter aquariorum]